MTVGESGNLAEYLPLMIPFVAIELILFISAFVHLFKHEKYKNGNRIIWIIVLLLGANLIGPILYFILGRSEDE